MFEKPNLFIVGASKCATTFLHDVLGAHPQIYMAKNKELYFFTRDDWVDKCDWYSSFFSNGVGVHYCGESTPAYAETTYFTEVPSRIFKFNPDSKIIFIIRSPFKRLASVYRQALSTGHWFEKKNYNKKMPKDFSQAVFEYPPFLEATKYWTHVQNYRKHFSDDAIKVLLFEDLVDDTPGTLREIFRFLKVDESAAIDYCVADKNTGEGKKIFNPWPNRIKGMVPDFILQSLPESVKILVRDSVKALTVKKMPPLVLSATDEASVREILTPEVEGIYRYLCIEDDPWDFFGTNRPHSTDNPCS